MISLTDWISQNLFAEDPLLGGVTLGILFLVSYDFYHLLFSAVCSWLKKDK